MRRHLLPILFILLVAVVLAACGGGGASNFASAPAPAMEMPAAEYDESASRRVMATVVVEKEVAMNAYDGAEEASGEIIQDDRKVIYNAHMNLVVKDTEITAQEIEALVTTAGGYIANMNAHRGGENTLYYDITLRVPAEEFDATRAALRQLSIRVDNEGVNTDDVTDRYFDMDARVRTLKATEDELLALLKEMRERDGKVEEIMSVYRELTNIRGQIESLQGQLNRLDKLVAFSTISVHLQPDVLTQPISTAWRPLETVRNSFSALVGVLQNLIDFLIGFIIVGLPTLLIIAIPIILVVLVVRWLLRRSRKEEK